MATNSSQSPTDRRTEVFKRLATLLKKLKETRPYLSESGNEENKDVCTLYVEGKLEEVKRLKKQVDAYSNVQKHFTKEYRTLEGHCTKLQMDLDRIDVTGRDDLEASQKQVLLQVDELIKSLSKKAHEDGQVCKNCEVKY